MHGELETKPAGFLFSSFEGSCKSLLQLGWAIDSMWQCDWKFTYYLCLLLSVYLFRIRIQQNQGLAVSIILQVVGVRLALIVMMDVLVQPNTVILVCGEIANWTWVHSVVWWKIFFDIDIGILVSESSALHSRPPYKKENGTNSYASPSFVASGVAGNNMSRQPPTHRLVSNL